MNFNALYDVVYIGNYTKDQIVSPAGIKSVDGGAVNYAAHAGVRLGFKVAVLTHLSKEDQRVVDTLQQAGVDCLPIYTSKSTCVKLEYPTHDVDRRNLYVTNTAGSFTASEVEPIHAKMFVIGTTLRGEVTLEVVRVLKTKKVPLAVDVQGFIRVLRGQTLVYEPWDEMQALLGSLDILKTDAMEAEFLSGTSDIYKAAHYFAETGPGEIVLTHKEGLLLHAQGEDYDIGFYPRSLNGRSGRGDTCLGAYAALRLRYPPKQAGIWAAAVTSLKMESPLPFNRDIHEVEEFIYKNYSDLNLTI
jgi:sugar/nucleoside kinase (ribokinase family)